MENIYNQVDSLFCNHVGNFVCPDSSEDDPGLGS